LVIEDSLTVRKRLVEVIGTDSDLEVVAEGDNGRTAIELCRTLRPDVITLDMNLPVMDGVSATEHIMGHFPTPILIVSSSTNRGDLFKTYDALAAGAVDVLEKPRAEDADGAWEKKFLAAIKLVSRIRVITHIRARLGSVGRAPVARLDTPVVAPVSWPPTGEARSVIALGASTGGPGALVDVLREIPTGIDATLLVVLHIDEPFSSAFADWLGVQTGHPVAYARGGEVLLRSAVTAIGPKQDQVGVLTGSGERQFDYVVLAAPFQNVATLLPSDESAKPLNRQLANFEPSSITGIHLWFDREITPLPHAVLLDRTIQWMFHKSKFHESREQADRGSYIELVVSASKSLVQKSREEILELATRELAEFFPAVLEAKLVKATVIKEIYATYAILPGLDKYRPMAKTQWPRIFLAGDWTATGWPATMEGAVRSGYLAAEALMESRGHGKKFVIPDLPSTGFMKLCW